jgi:ABC-type transport system involved in multi-copper enzyme maturation permease subunit
MSIVTTLARVTLLEAIRNRLLWLTLILVAAAFGLAQFLNQVAIAETREIQSALLAAPLRIGAVFIVAAFVITSMTRESSDKVSELLLSLPAPRSHYFFGRFVGFAAAGAVLALLCALPLAAFAKPLGLALWTASLVCELVIVSAISLFCVLSLGQVVPAFAAVGGFYLLSRSMSAMQVIASASLHDQSLADRIVGAVVAFIALLLPSLDGMTQTAWLLGDIPGNAGVHVFGQAGIYVALICSAALFDLYRKNY